MLNIDWMGEDERRARGSAVVTSTTLHWKNTLLVFVGFFLTGSTSSRGKVQHDAAQPGKTTKKKQHFC